tara:strand:- start:37 stop:204 length:168 start_codon:yes stop_codon:yes gene_type:complete
MNWLKSRLKERTSWDGLAVLALGVVILVASPFAKIAAYGAIVYGLWTLLKSESND